MLQLEARITRREMLSGGRERVIIHAPEIAERAQPGQLVAIQMGSSPFEPLLRQPTAIAAAIPATGVVMLLCGEQQPGPAAPPGETLDLLGPLGRGWSLDERSRNLLLIGTEAHAGALLFLAEVAGRRGCNVTLLIGAQADRAALESALVPPAVEYQFSRGADAAGAALDLVDDTLLRWSDALYTTLPVSAYPPLADRIRATRMRWEAGYAQGLLVPPMACFAGICHACLIPEVRKSWLACADGPQCDLRDFVR